MAETQKAPCLRLLLDNGGTIERQPGEAARYLSFAKRIALGQLSTQQQSKQVDEIASVFQRLSENAMPQPKRAVTAPLAQEPHVNSLRPTKPVKAEPVEPVPLPVARPKASAPKAAPAPKPPAAPEPSYGVSHRTASGRLSSQKKKALKAMIESVWKADTFGVFKLPVTKRIAPDYYDIVKEPMDLKTVRQNLDKGAYEDEHAFKHDMDLIFYNCELYNGTVSEVGKHGVIVKKVWMKAWQNSGLDTGDGGTSFPTPGYASQPSKSAKRPYSMSDAQPAAKAARTGAGGRTPAHSAAAGAPAGLPHHAPLPAAPKSAPSATPGTGGPGHKSSAAVARASAAAAAPAMQAPRNRGPFSEDRSTALFEYIGAIDETQQTAVLEFLQHQCQVELPMDEDGEVELDPDALSAEVLWKLDDHMRETSNGSYKPDAVLAEPVLALANGHDEETDDE